MQPALKMIFILLSTLGLHAYAAGEGDKTPLPYSPSENFNDVPGAPRGNAASSGITNEDLRNSQEGTSKEDAADSSNQNSFENSRQTGSMSEAQARRLQRVKKTGASFKPSPSSAQSKPHSKKSDPSFQNPIEKSDANNPATEDHQ